MLFETLLTEHTTVKIRVKADSAEEAENIFNEFMDDDEGYLSEELDLNGTKEWVYSDFKEIHPKWFDEGATITKHEDGTFDATYEGGEE